MEFYYLHSYFTTIMQDCHKPARMWTPCIKCHNLGTTFYNLTRLWQGYYWCSHMHRHFVDYVPSSMICPIAVLGLQIFILFFPAEFCVSSWIVKISVPSYTLSLIIGIVKFAVVFLWSNLTLLSVFAKSLPPARH